MADEESKKMSDIEDDYIEKAEHARRTINNSEKLSITYFPGVNEVPQGHYNTKGEWEKDNPKFQYNGGAVKDTYSEANDDRNKDIDSKIGLINSKIGFCNSRKGELDNIKTDCNKSLNNLHADSQVLTKAQNSFNSISSSMASAMNGYDGAISSLNSAYCCQPKNLNTRTSSAISTTTKSFSSTSISDGITTLSGAIEKGDNILAGIDSLTGKLNEKIEALEKQKTKFEAMKS